MRGRPVDLNKIPKYRWHPEQIIGRREMEIAAAFYTTRPSSLPEIVSVGCLVWKLSCLETAINLVSSQQSRVIY